MRVYRRLIPTSLLAAAILLVSIALYGARQEAGVQVEKDVVYGTAGGQSLLLDVFRPEGAQKIRPAIILVHGGGWSGGDKKDFGDIAKGLARLGYVGFSVNYRLANAQGNKYPAQIDDVQRAVRWIRANASRYSIDPKRIGAIGASAGGHLVALLGTRDTRDNSDAALAKYSSKVACVVDIFGPTDFTGPDNAKFGQITMAILQNFFGKTPDKAPQAYREASPIVYVNKLSAPFLIFHGSADPLVPLDQSQRFYGALKAAGCEAELVTFEGEGHGFREKKNTDVFIQKTVAFFAKHLKP